MRLGVFLGGVCAAVLVGSFSSSAFASCDPDAANLSEAFFGEECVGDTLVAYKTTRAGSTKKYTYSGKTLVSVQRVQKTGNAKVVARASLGSVCKSIRNLQSGEIWKSIASHHITDGRRTSTSFICNRNRACSNLSCISAYDKKGNLVHKLGRYFPTGAFYSIRSYGGYGCGDHKRASAVAAEARAKTGSSEIYLAVKGTQCIRIPNPALCYNSAGC